MKKLLLVSISMLLLYSCGKHENGEEIIVKKVEQDILPRFNDPESYEFVSLKLVDSLSYQQNIEGELSLYKSFIDQNWILKNAGVNNDKEIDNYRLIIEKLDSIKNTLAEDIDNIASYTYLFTCRGNNKLGAKVLNEYYVQVDRENNILNIADDEDKILLTAGGFPGFDEIKSRYIMNDK